jgi:O-antigen/teichoic acid export membrane protein
VRLGLPALTGAKLQHLWYVPVLGAAMALMLLRLLVMARLLDVEAFASYSAGLLVSSSFLMLACFGLQSLLQRDLPVAIVRGRERAGAVLLAQCCIVTVLSAAVVMAPIGLLQPTLAGLGPGLLALSILHGLAMQVFLLATVESRSRGEPLRFSWQNLARSVLLVTAGALTALWMGGAGWVLGVEMLLSLGLALAFGRRQFASATRPATIIAAVAWRRMRCLPWRAALALLAVSFVSFLMVNADRWLAAETLPKPLFASYAFAWMVLLVAQSVQVLVNASLFPMLSRRFARSGHHAAVSAGARISIALLLAGTVIALPAWAVLDYAVSRWFPAYSEARAILPVLLGVAVLRVSDFWSSVLIITGLESRLLRVNLLGMMLGFCAWVGGCTAVGMGYTGPVQIAWLAAMLASCTYGLVSWTAWRAAPVGRSVA